jgi:oligoendopeptidase F
MSYYRIYKAQESVEDLTLALAQAQAVVQADAINIANHEELMQDHDQAQSDAIHDKLGETLQQETRQASTLICYRVKRLAFEPRPLAYIHLILKSRHLSLYADTFVPVPAYDSSTSTTKDSCDSLVSSGSY